MEVSNVKMNNLPYSDVKVSTDGGVLAITFDSEFGEITISLSIDAFQAQLSRIVSDVINKYENDDPTFLSNIAKEYGISEDEVRSSLEAAIRFRKRVRLNDAVEQFLQGKDMNVQGMVEQFIDNLPAGVVLLFSHMAISTIARTVPDVQRHTRTKPGLPNDELLKLVNPYFKKSIAKLWQRK
jgi:hypothetical protein